MASVSIDRRAMPKNWLVHEILASYVEESITHAHGLVLDVGCGRRPYEMMFRDRSCQYIGLEQPNSANAPSEADLYGDAGCLPIRSSSCDTVVSFQVLEHLPDPQRGVAEMARVLKPGGHLILTAPHIWGLHEEPHDYFRFTKYGLRYLCESSGGLEVVYVKAMAGYWVTAAQRLCYYLQNFEHKLGMSLLLPPTWFVIQAVGRTLDRLHRDETDTWNWIIV